MHLPSCKQCILQMLWAVVKLLGSLYDVTDGCYLGSNNIDWDMNVVVIFIVISDKYSQNQLDCTTFVTM
jgi:hypothetical protein